ncbi:MAG: CBS domain-containing protein [Candidatus Delongbacteria bacterium]|nr:CBS domain-containing protein [Candidatus Delongbacteria bacterium]
MIVARLLKQKGQEVFSVSPDSTVRHALEQLVENRVGSLLVRSGEDVVGIITERDIIRNGLTGGRLLADQRVEEIMSRDVLIATPSDSLQYVMKVMTRSKIRHMPVYDEGKLVGLVSIGDLVFSMLEESADEIRHLNDYISGSW